MSMKIYQNIIDKINKKKFLYYIIPLISTLLLYFLLNIITTITFKINLLSSFYIIPDIILITIISYILFLFSKRISLFLMLQMFIMVVIYIGDSVKTSFFGAPIILQDVTLLKALILYILTINIFYIILSIIILLCIFFIIIYNFKFRKSGLILFLFFSLFIISINVFPDKYTKLIIQLDKKYLFWNQQENYKYNGPIFYFLSQYIRSNKIDEIPNEKSVVDTLTLLNKKRIVNYNTEEYDTETLPNIYFILAESLWDPMLLNNTEFSQDPFYKGFRELRDKAKDNLLVSPTLGGKTANPEFELLCGIPILRNSIAFQADIKNDLECLPNVLDKLGYETNAFHPDYASFYNRTNIYKKIGFDQYFSLNDYKRDDLNNGMLSDKSFLDQSYELSKNNSGKPQFNYYLTLSSHIPYTLNDSRPVFIKNNIDNEWINNYANSMYYSTKEISEFVKKIQNDDPKSIIIVAGDHLPFLGMNQEVYNKTNTLDELTLHSTPLIFIKNGESKNLGTLNMFQLPNKILKEIGINTDDTMLNFFNLDGIRPLYVDQTTPKYIEINKGAKINQDAINSLDYYRIIYNDLLFGKQYVYSSNNFTK